MNELNQKAYTADFIGEQKNRKGENSEIYKSAMAAWEDADTETAYDLFEQVINEYPENETANILFTVCGNAEGYFDDEILADAFCESYPKLSGDMYYLSSYMCSYFEGTVDDLIQNSAQAYKGKLSHSELVDFVRSTEGATRIFETITKVIEERGDTNSSEYKDCLKYLFLLYPLMQVDCLCSECGGYCKSSVWKINENCEKKLQIVKEKLENLKEDFSLQKYKDDKIQNAQMTEEDYQNNSEYTDRESIPERKIKDTKKILKKSFLGLIIGVLISFISFAKPEYFSRLQIFSVVLLVTSSIIALVSFVTIIEQKSKKQFYCNRCKKKFRKDEIKDINILGIKNQTDSLVNIFYAAELKCSDCGNLVFIKRKFSFSKSIKYNLVSGEEAVADMRKAAIHDLESYIERAC